jgi:hypothetical protein
VDDMVAEFNETALEREEGVVDPRGPHARQL